MNPCLLIPIYNHTDTIADVLAALAYLALPCLVIDDGSNEMTRAVLDSTVRELPWVTVSRLPENRGRGAALRHGYRSAWAQGFSHAVQLDADGQHDAADVPKFLDAAIDAEVKKAVPRARWVPVEMSPAESAAQSAAKIGNAKGNAA